MNIIPANELVNNYFTPMKLEVGVKVYLIDPALSVLTNSVKMLPAYKNVFFNRVIIVKDIDPDSLHYGSYQLYRPSVNTVHAILTLINKLNGYNNNGGIDNSSLYKVNARHLYEVYITVDSFQRQAFLSLKTQFNDLKKLIGPYIRNLIKDAMPTTWDVPLAKKVYVNSKYPETVGTWYIFTFVIPTLQHPFNLFCNMRSDAKPQATYDHVKSQVKVSGVSVRMAVVKIESTTVLVIGS